MSEDHAKGVSGGEDVKLWLHPLQASTQVFPLNSRHLTGQYVRSIAKAMDLPTKGTVKAMKVMMEGKWTELNRDPHAVQVKVHEGDRVTVCLRDSDGMFVRADCLPAQDGSNMVEETEANKEGQESDSLANENNGAAELADVQAWNRALEVLNDELTTQVSILRVEISTLTDKLRRETERVGEVWRMNCEQVSSFDETVTAKDEEIDTLKAGILELEASRVNVSPSGVHPTTSQPLHGLASGHSLEVVPSSPHSFGGTAINGGGNEGLGGL